MLQNRREEKKNNEDENEPYDSKKLQKKFHMVFGMLYVWMLREMLFGRCRNTGIYFHTASNAYTIRL